MNRLTLRNASLLTMTLAATTTLLTGCPGGGGDDDDRLLVTTLADEDNDDDVVSLREALAYALEQGGSQRVRFKADLSGTIMLGSPLVASGQASQSVVIEAAPTQEIVVSAGAEGGRVLVVDGPSLTLGGLTLTKGSTDSSDGGGCVYVSAGALTVDGGRFVECATTGILRGGGAIRANGGTTLTLRDVVFEKNSSAQRGGAIEAEGGLSVSGGSFLENSAGGFGGSIYVNSGVLSVDGTEFTKNSANRGAGIGAHAVTALTVTLNDVTFKENSSSESGGGLYVNANTMSFDDQVKVTIESSTFEQNRGSGGGGVFLSGYLNAEVSNSSFTGNVAEGDAISGGGFRGQGRVKIVQSTFDSNEARGSAGANVDGSGGAVSVGGLSNQDELRIEECTFQGNSAGNGGAVHASFVKVFELKNSTLSGNNARLNGGGASIRAVDGAGVIEGSTIEQNIAMAQGGGLSTAGDLRITSTQIRQNTANFGGGITTSAGTTLTLGAECFVTANSAVNPSASESFKVGGGVNNDGDVVLSGGMVTGNNPDEFSSPDNVM